MPYLTQEQFNEMSLPAQQVYVDLMRRSGSYVDQAYLRRGEEGYIPPYSGDRIAPIPPDIQNAHTAISDGGKEYSEMAASQAGLNQAIKPFHENYNAYMNPYQQAVLQQLSEEGNRNFKENIMPALDARFVKLGQFGSTNHVNLGLRAARDFQKELLSRQQQALHSGYEKASDIYNSQQNRHIDATLHHANISNLKQAARLADANALESIGRYKQQHRQSELDTQYQEYLRQLHEPIRRMEQQAAILHGIPNFSSSSTAFSETPNTAPTSAPSNIGNIASSLLAARLMGGRQ